VADTFERVALACQAVGDYPSAIRVLGETFQMRRFFLTSQFGEAGADEIQEIAQKTLYRAFLFHSLLFAAPSRPDWHLAQQGAEQLAQNKAVLEELERTQTKLENDPDTTTRDLRISYRSIQTQIDNLSRGAIDPIQRDAKRRALQDQLDNVVDRLAGKIGLIGDRIRDSQITIFDIASHLPSEACLVDFVQYRRYDFAARTNQWREQRYAAYVTFPLVNGSTNVVVRRVDLGEAAPINESIALICRRMSAGQFAARDLTGASQHLSELIYTPLSRYLTNVSHLIICPDGQLSRVPFEMLPVGSEFLVEEKTISYVTSGREIVRFTNSEATAGRLKSVVMGNPDFNFDLANARPLNSPFQLAVGPSALRSLSRDYNGLKFQPLPGAEAEARSVAKLLGDEAVLYLGADARETALKAVQSPRVLHLATHGFYFPDQELNPAATLDQARRLPYANGNNDWENPMVRCGIALAGANHAMEITNALAEDGLLTGLDASLLNLEGTELVILSACDSGTGDVKIGEGVMSLRRAFLIAGAQTVLASHWEISDKGTSQLMTEFMRRWQAGEPRITAWREAQLSLLRSKDFANPYFWAAFTLTGRWR
jgi:CHAT domain-containing protein